MGFHRLGSHLEIPQCAFSQDRGVGSPLAVWNESDFPTDYTLPDSLVEQGPGDRVPLGVSFVVQRVQVGQQRVADVQVVLGAAHQQGVGSKHSWILMLQTNNHCFIARFSETLCQRCEKLFQRGWGPMGQLCTGVLSLLVHQGYSRTHPGTQVMPRSSQGSAWWLTQASVFLGGRSNQYS